MEDPSHRMYGVLRMPILFFFILWGDRSVRHSRLDFFVRAFHIGLHQRHTVVMLQSRSRPGT